MPIIRRHPRRFTIIPNEAIESGLSYEALGVLAYLLSKPDDWTIHVSELRQHGNIGRDKMQRILRELREAMLLHLRKIKDPDTGKMKGEEYVLYDAPRALENRQPEKPAAGKSAPILNTDSLPMTDSVDGNNPHVPLTGNRQGSKSSPPSRVQNSPDEDSPNHENSEIPYGRPARKKKLTFKDAHGGTVPDEWIAWAQQRGLSRRDAMTEADAFAEYWTGIKRQTKRLSWKATWNMWVMKNRNYTPARMKGRSEGGGREAAPGWLDDALGSGENAGNRSGDAPSLPGMTGDGNDDMA